MHRPGFLIGHDEALLNTIHKKAMLELWKLYGYSGDKGLAFFAESDYNIHIVRFLSIYLY